MPPLLILAVLLRQLTLAASSQSVPLEDPTSDLADLAWSPCGRYLAAWSSVTEVQHKILAGRAKLTRVSFAVPTAPLQPGRPHPVHLHSLLVPLTCPLTGHILFIDYSRNCIPP